MKLQAEMKERQSSEGRKDELLAQVTQLTQQIQVSSLEDSPVHGRL